MSRRPLTDAAHRRLVTSMQTTGYADVIARSSNFFDPPSGVKKKAKPRARDWTKAFERCVESGREIMRTGKAPQSAADLVGLYAVLHEFVFDVLPLELKQDYGAAVSSADRLVREEFAGDYAHAERFVAWCWKRTKQATKKRRADGGDPFRPGWRIQFKSRSWLTDYKAAGKR